MSTCWSLGRAAWLHLLQSSRTQACDWRAHSLPCNRLFPCLSPASRVAWELGGGVQSRGAVGHQPWQVPLQFTAVPSPFCFFNLSIGCASCRNFSPSGWQPQQVPAWGAWQPWRRLRGRTRALLSASSSLCMVMLTPFPPFPELIHGCY